jgi:hypothetical protein
MSTAPVSPGSSPARADVEQLLRLQRIRKVIVYLALGLLVVSFLKPNGAIVILRSLMWGTAGVICVLEAQGLAKIGQKPMQSYINGLLYFGLAGLIFFTGR